MALVLARRKGDEIKLTLDPEYTQADLYELVTNGIVLTVTNTESNLVKLAFDGPKSIIILRAELIEG